MKKIALCLLLALFTLFVNAQFSVRLVVTTVATKQNDEIYVAGTFNNWNPKDEKYKLKPFAGGRKSIVIKDVAAGNYAFKFTRGSFDKVECTNDGRDIADRIVDVNADLSQEITIAGWKDDYPDKPKRYTASPQVKVIDTAFKMPQLNSTRKIWIYLPKSYASSTKTYPVLYMHDGQNLFNEQTAYAAEWGIDECLDSLQQKIAKECIVVGIDNGGDKRMSEYSPYNYSLKGAFTTPENKGEGKQYVDFLVQTLKPYIDTKYRTKKGPDFTFIAGSSMGGLISAYAIMQYPQVFGAAGIFSPSFWIAPNIYTEATNFTTTALPRFFMYAGAKEDATMVTNVTKMETILKTKPRYEVTTQISPLGQHNEAYWKLVFPGFYTWLMTANIR
ncbi:MAG: alpha/beta hydrolase-fold protein [Flavobacterium sp.]|nr:alpha/beta hydrolase-fold protein [Flavobacterium sp.]